jgi:hypothetical protein
VAVQAGHQLGEADGVADVLVQLGGERRHPADHDRRLDPLVQRRQVAGAQPAHRQADAADPLRVHLRPRQQVIDRAQVVPEHHARPGEAGRVNRPADELLVLRGAGVELPDALGGEARRPLAPVGRVVVEQHPPLAPVEHVDDGHHVALPGQLGGDALAGVVGLLERRQGRVLVLALDQLFLAPQVEAAVVVQRDHRRRRPLGLLREEDVGGHADVGGGVEVDLLLEVVAVVGLVEDLGLRVAPRRGVVQQLQELAAGLALPGVGVLELVAQERQGELPRRLAADEGEQRAHVRAGPRRGRRLGPRFPPGGQGAAQQARGPVHELASRGHMGLPPSTSMAAA